MELQNIQWKIHLENAGAAKPQEWFQVFNTWIPDPAEIFVDVADYSHVEDGPVILLSGHETFYSLDGIGRRLGLLYDRRQPLAGSEAGKLKATLSAVLNAAVRLENDAGFSEKPRFLAGDLLFAVNNRALSPNNEATLAAVKPELEALLGKVYGAGGFSLEREPDARQKFAVRIKAKAPLSAGEALKRLVD
jgi:hypothetical protein